VLTDPEEEERFTPAPRRGTRSKRSSSISATQRLGLMKLVHESIGGTHSGDPQMGRIVETSHDDDDIMDDDIDRSPTRSRHSNAVLGLS
jgi:hypothetical protein